MIVQVYKVVDGIKVFHDDIDKHHEDYDAQGLENLFKEEERHFWFLARKGFIFQQMKKYIQYSSRTIEIGAGTGNVSRYLMRQGYSRVAVGEMHSNGLRYAQTYGIKECYQFDLLKAPFEGEFDAVCMFDVLEHIVDDMLALNNVKTMLVDTGKIILTVPAHQWLWNCDDDLAGHKRRYTKAELVQKLEQSGFDVDVARYFFISIVPLLWLRKLRTMKKREQSLADDSSSGIAMNPILSSILYAISKVENKLNKFLPNWFGGSLLIIASKR